MLTIGALIEWVQPPATVLLTSRQRNNMLFHRNKNANQKFMNGHNNCVLMYALRWPDDVQNRNREK